MSRDWTVSFNALARPRPFVADSQGVKGGFYEVIQTSQDFNSPLNLAGEGLAGMIE
jgi:hypothetical protein